MKNLEQRLSEDLLITQSSNSLRKFSDPIPVDILIDIFSRVPAKSIARFRCVSKLWESILRRHDFTELFLTKSVARPRLFFFVEVNEELLAFSSPQNPNDSSALVTGCYKSFPKYFPTEVFTLHCGLIFLRSWESKARVICNPATGESITVPKVKATDIGESYFGFDPISKQYKVLYMTWSCNGTPNTHRVLTLKTGKRLWRTVQDPLPHHCRYGSEICINGVLYYKASIEGFYKMVCFDFRFDKFSLINIDKDMRSRHAYQHMTLFNNKGKLGALMCTDWFIRERLVFWVLEDAGKHKWSKSICLLPGTGEIVNNYNIAGMTGTGEIVFIPSRLSNPFYIFYCNIERKILTRVNIKGFEEFKNNLFFTIFLDYVENVKFM